MPEFDDPSSGTIPKHKLTEEELVQAIRLNIAAAHEAIHLYMMAHAGATDHPLAKEVLVDIANEESVHIGEFERLLEILAGDESKWVAEGRKEVNEMVAEMARGGAAGSQGQAGAPVAVVKENTTGSLRGEDSRKGVGRVINKHITEFTVWERLAVRIRQPQVICVVKEA
jgi:hypothetical protein